MEIKKGEDILKVRNTRKVYIFFYLMIFILIAAIVYIKYNGAEIDDFAIKLVLIFAIFILISTEIHRLGNSYEINDHSVVHRRGYLNINSSRFEFGAISDSDVHQSLWQRFFSYGNAEVHLFSKENRILIRDINKPYEFVRFLHKKMGAFRRRNG